MEPIASQTVILAVFLFINSVLALHMVKVITVNEFTERRASRPEDDIPLIKLDTETREQLHLQYFLDRLKDKSLHVVGPCNGVGVGRQCNAPRHPLFPFPDSYRNKFLSRPPPETVRANIVQATNGKLSTVDQLVERVNANIEDLSALSDNELTVLATNFAGPEAGLIVKMICRSSDYDGWPEDILVSQDEQRALMAGFLYVFGDEGYQARQDARRECEACVIFGARVEQLVADMFVSETEWLWRYNAYVAALRAELYGMTCGRPRQREDIGPLFEKAISAVEEIVDEIIDKSVRDEPGFAQFLEEARDGIRFEFPELSPGIVRTLAYRRWRTLSIERQAA